MVHCRETSSSSCKICSYFVIFCVTDNIKINITRMLSSGMRTAGFLPGALCLGGSLCRGSLSWGSLSGGVYVRETESQTGVKTLFAGGNNFKLMLIS